jgi:signal peptidase II
LKKIILPLVIIVLSVIIDQLTKAWALANLTHGSFNSEPEKFFQFTLVFNDGGAMGTNFGSPMYYLISSILILLFVFYYIYANRDIKALAIPLSFIAGGAIGNITDRFIRGQVVDFIDVDFFDLNIFGYQLYRWWTFNMADVFISCSIVFLLYLIIFTKKLHNLPEFEKLSD